MFRFGIISTEAVLPGHPDKICDRISDGVLDFLLAKDKNARGAIECLATSNFLAIAGEMKSDFSIQKDDINNIAMNIIRDFGENRNFDTKTLTVHNIVHRQSSDIAIGVDAKNESTEGAGDQGMMFGYATNEDESYCPKLHKTAHNIMKNIYFEIKDGKIKGLGPDGKVQLSYDVFAKKLTSIVLSIQHSEHFSTADVKDLVIPIIDNETCNYERVENFHYYINRTGKFVIGGPEGDAGLTGRKIIVDSYGGFAPHGGGAFSGKDPTKVDRSGAYMARCIAKNIVAQGISQKCLVEISYCIGTVQPVGLTIKTSSGNKNLDEKITQYIRKNIDLSPRGIINLLNLQKIKYYDTALFGHFGHKARNDCFTWENEKLLDFSRL